MQWLNEFFNPQKPYNNASNVLNNYYNQGQNYLAPYQQGGVDAQSRLQSLMSMLGDPAKLQSQWSSGYEMSPYAKQLQQNAQQSGLDAASSMGLMGSNSALSNIQNSSSNIMQADRQQYMNDLMDKLRMGAGIGQGLYSGGLGAAGQLSSNAMHQGENQANLQFGRDRAGSDLLGRLGSGGLQMLMQYLTGGMGQGGFGRGSMQPNFGNFGGQRLPYGYGGGMFTA